MVNKELVELCRTVVAAIQEADTFDAAQLRRLLLHIVPQLLTEIDILGGALESVLQRRPVIVDEPASIEIVLDEPHSSQPKPARGHKKTAKRKKARARRK